MKTILRLRLILLAFALAVPGRAQTVPDPSATAAPAGSDNKTVVMSPLVVNAPEDRGFIPTSEMAGTRLMTDLKDTPAPYSVLTEQFIQAFNITDAAQAADFFVGSFNQPDNGTNQAFSIIQNYNIRGAAPSQSQYPTVNYFPENVVRDSYNVQQYEEGRGANSILFGSGPFTGNLNIATKQALTGRTIHQVQLQWGSFQFYRATADLNQPINRKVALRTDLLWQHNSTYMLDSLEKRKAIYLNGVVHATSSTDIHLEGEYGEYWKLDPNREIFDNVSGWDGKTVFASFNPSLSIPTATRNAEGLSQLGTRYIFDPTSGSSAIVNYQNSPITQPGSAVGQFIGGQQIVGASIQHAGPFIGENWPASRFANALAGSSGFYIPGRFWDNTFTGTPTFTQNFKDATLTFDQHFGNTLFFQLAGNLEKESSVGLNAQGQNQEFIDLNQILPTGAPNPGYLRPYNDVRRYDEPRWVDFRNARFAGAWTRPFDFLRSHVTINFLTGMQYQHTENRAYINAVPVFSASIPDLRAIAQGGQGGADMLYYRQYWDQPDRGIPEFVAPMTVFNPQTGQTQIVTPIRVLDVSRTDNTASAHNNYKYLQAAGNVKLWGDKLVILAAARRDFYYNITRGPIHPADFPANWDGRQLIFKPDAPLDYFNLTYVPKDSTGKPTGPAQPALNRPRHTVNGVSVGLPQYANDRFQDDYNPPAIHGAVNTASIGGVVNPTPWLGLYANVGQTFSLPVPLISYQNTLLPNTKADDLDAGIRFHLLHGRLEMSIGAYQSKQNNVPVRAIGGGNFNSILNLAPVNDSNPGDANGLGMPLLPSVIEDTITQKTRGLEFEMTANLTSGWRLIGNVAFPRIYQSNGNPGFLLYYKTHLAALQQILTQGGLAYDPNTNTWNRVAGVNYQNDVNNRVNNAINAWNSLQNTDLPNANTGSKETYFPGFRKIVAHLGTDYTWQSGPLAGFELGGAVQYNGPQMIGTTAGTTVVNPANPTGPGIEVGSPFQAVFTDPYTIVQATMGYTWHLQHGRRLALHFLVNNLFNYRQPIYYVSIQGAVSSDMASRAVNGNVSSPARVQTPNNYTFAVPRSFNLSMTLDF